MRLVPLFLGSLLGLTPAPAVAQAALDAKDAPIVAGWVERISFPQRDLLFEAKLDTGADSSSINGRNIRRLTREGRSFVGFDLVDDTGKAVRIESAVVRRVRVKRAGGRDDSRAVVRLKVCVGGQVADTEFTIADRDDLDFQVLIGRNMLAGRIMVDSARQRIVSDRCMSRT